MAVIKTVIAIYIANIFDFLLDHVALQTTFIVVLRVVFLRSFIFYVMSLVFIFLTIMIKS